MGSMIYLVRITVPICTVCQLFIFIFSSKKQATKDKQEGIDCPIYVPSPHVTNDLGI